MVTLGGSGLPRIPSNSSALPASSSKGSTFRREVSSVTRRTLSAMAWNSALWMRMRRSPDMPRFLPCTGGGTRRTGRGPPCWRGRGVRHDPLVGLFSSSPNTAKAETGKVRVARAGAVESRTDMRVGGFALCTQLLPSSGPAYGAFRHLSMAVAQLLRQAIDEVTRLHRGKRYWFYITEARSKGSELCFGIDERR